MGSNFFVPIIPFSRFVPFNFPYSLSISTPSLSKKGPVSPRRWYRSIFPGSDNLLLLDRPDIEIEPRAQFPPFSMIQSPSIHLISISPAALSPGGGDQGRKKGERDR